MRKDKILPGLFFAWMLFFAVAAKGQGGGADPARPGPYDKKVVSLQAKIGEDSAKLVKYRGMVSSFEQNKKDAADKAQQSADDNKKAAGRLSDDPQSKKLARKASDAAGDAKSDAKKARVAGEKLDDLNKDIEKLTKQLEKEHEKLEKLQIAAQPAAGGSR